MQANSFRVEEGRRDDARLQRRSRSCTTIASPRRLWPPRSNASAIGRPSAGDTAAEVTQPSLPSRVPGSRKWAPATSTSALSDGEPDELQPVRPLRLSLRVSDRLPTKSAFFLRGDLAPADIGR